MSKGSKRIMNSKERERQKALNKLKQSINQKSENGGPLTQRVSINNTPGDGLSAISSSQKVHKESRFLEHEMGQLNSKIILERKGERGFKTIDDLKD